MPHLIVAMYIWNVCAICIDCNYVHLEDKYCLTEVLQYIYFQKGRGAIRADFGPKSEINFVAITI